MLTFSTERTVKNIFIICAHFFFRINSYILLQFRGFNQVYDMMNQYIVNQSLLCTTLSIKPKSFANSGVIKLSLSSAALISSAVLPVCFE